jgi:hypothetical protein
VNLLEARASHLQRMWAEVSSFAPHFLHSGLSLSPIKRRCLYRVLCPVRSPVTTLDCSLLRDKTLALLPRLGPEINSRACRWEGPRSCHRCGLRVWNQLFVAGHGTMFSFSHFPLEEIGFGGLVVSMLPSGTQDHEFEPGRSRRIFRAKKSTACVHSEGK